MICLSAFTPALTTAQDATVHTNRLAKESSPYLLQHAHNPVDWYPWGPEALARAKKERKPIFLSVGYSSCFWCHVMERKVFENEEIAEFMNEHFVNIKVDREERPDIDEIYMLSLQVYLQLAGSSQGGGWPLSMFLTPDGEPIAGGTYFPPEDMPGRPGFMTVMKQLHAAWRDQQQAVQQTASVVAQEVKRLSQPTNSLLSEPLSEKDISAAVNNVLEHYDPEHGGFDFQPTAPNKPKFPVPSKLMLIQQQIARGAANSAELAQKLDHSLQAMAFGGIYDHLGGGFHRYSTDRKWLVPHFEKMLYDNAQLAEVYVDAFRRTRNPLYRDVANGIFQFILNEMTDEQGGFYSALDAETDGVEGQYYVWSKDETQQILSANSYRYFAAAYGLNEPLEFEHGYVLHLPIPVSQTAEDLGMPLAEMQAHLDRSRQMLLAQRTKRKPLRRDDKILTSWNGLMIRAFARGGQVLQRADYTNQAVKAALYLLSNSRDREGRLLRSMRDGTGTLPGYLDDYAFLVSGLLALHEATGEEKWLHSARLLTDQQINLFLDNNNGGFFFTSHDHESLIARTKTAYDSVIPSGNSVTVQNLLRLGTLTNDLRYVEHAEKTANAFARQMRQTPGNLAYFALASQALVAGQGGNAVAVNTENPTKEPTSPPTGKPKLEDKLIPGLKPDPKAAAKDKTVSAVGYFAATGVVTGKTIPVAIEVTLADDWHINANPTQPDFVIPTELVSPANSVVTLHEITYPKGQKFELQGIDEPLSVYEGKVILRAKLKVPDNVSGEVPVEIQLRYQACNSESCLAPKRLMLNGSLKIIPAGTSAIPINQSLFAKESR